MYNSLTGKKKLVCEQDIMESIALIWDWHEEMHVLVLDNFQIGILGLRRPLRNLQQYNARMLQILELQQVIDNYETRCQPISLSISRSAPDMGVCLLTALLLYWKHTREYRPKFCPNWLAPCTLPSSVEH